MDVNDLAKELEMKFVGWWSSHNGFTPGLPGDFLTGVAVFMRNRGDAPVYCFSDEFAAKFDAEIE